MILTASSGHNFAQITQLQIEEQNATIELRTKNRRIKIIIGDTRYM